MMKIVAPNNITNLDELDIEQTVYEPFASILIEFIDDVSKNILKDNAFKEFPELLALAFWMRKAHIRKLKNYFLDKSQDKFLLGKGVVFHLAPSSDKLKVAHPSGYQNNRALFAVDDLVLILNQPAS